MDCVSVVLPFTKNPVVKYNLTSVKHVGAGAATLEKEVDEECNKIPSHLLSRRDMV